jgi:hypothetical protein
LIRILLFPEHGFLDLHQGMRLSGAYNPGTPDPAKAARATTTDWIDQAGAATESGKKGAT